MKTNTSVHRAWQKSRAPRSQCMAAFLFITLLPVSSQLPAQDDEQKVKDYIAKQKAAGIEPQPSNPNWKAGFTCNDLKKFSFAEYQECRYYYAVHGRFYKY